MHILCITMHKCINYVRYVENFGGILNGFVMSIYVSVYTYIGYKRSYSLPPHILKVNFYAIVILFLYMHICSHMNRNALQIEGHFLCVRNVYLFNFIIYDQIFRANFRAFVILLTNKIMWACAPLHQSCTDIK